MPKKLNCYEWSGIDSLSLYLYIDGKKEEAYFPAGKEKPKTNAQFFTDNESIQNAIEETRLFKDGHVKLKSSRAISESEAEEVNTSGNAQKAPKKVQYKSVTDYQQAAEKLAEKYAIPLTQLNSPEAIMAKAEEVGALFPNLSSLL